MPLADFEAVIARAIGGLSENTPEMRMQVYEKARGAVLRQLQSMTPLPSDDLVHRQMDKLALAIRSVEEEQRILKVLSSERPNPTQWVPVQQPGLSFGITESGRIGIRPNSPASEEDLAELGNLATVLKEAVDDLIEVTEGSNAYRHIGIIARRYRKAFDEETGDIYVDTLYGQGIRLQNAAARLRLSIAQDDFPDLALPIAEALDSVVAMHGPTIMSTELGRLLIDKARQYHMNAEDEDRYRTAALNLWRESNAAEKVVVGEDLQQVVEINASVADATAIRHTNALAHSTNVNLLSSIAKVVAIGGTSIVVGKAFENSVPSLVSTQHLTTLFDNAWLFLTKHEALLRALSASAGGDLAWIDPFLRWMRTRNENQ